MTLRILIVFLFYSVLATAQVEYPIPFMAGSWDNEADMRTYVPDNTEKPQLALTKDLSIVWYYDWDEANAGVGSGWKLIGGDNLGNHSATQKIELNNWEINSTSQIKFQNAGVDAWSIVGGYLNNLEPTKGILLNGGSIGNDSDDLTFDIQGNAIFSSRIVGGVGASTTTGNNDWNHATNSQSGYPEQLLNGNAPNGPNQNLDALYHCKVFEFGTVKDGTGDLTQYAIPFSEGNDDEDKTEYYRFRTNGVWSSKWYKKFNSANISTAFQFECDQTNLGTTFTANGGWSGGATATHTPGSVDTVTMPVTLIRETSYFISYDITGNTAGRVKPISGGTYLLQEVNNGTHTDYFVATDDDIIFISTSDFDGTLSNVIINECSQGKVDVVSKLEVKDNIKLFGALNIPYGHPIRIGEGAYKNHGLSQFKLINESVAIGHDSGNGGFGVMIGGKAGASLTTGMFAGIETTGGGVIIGANAGNKVDLGHVTIVGHYAGKNVTNANSHIFGDEAGATATDKEQTAFGYYALHSMSNGFGCGFGNRIFRNQTSGISTGIGVDAGLSSINAELDVLGWEAARSMQTGNLIAIGRSAAYGLTPANAPVNDTKGILIGRLANRSVPSATQLNNYIGIGDQVQVSKSNQVVLGNSSITETLLRGYLGLTTQTVAASAINESIYKDVNGDLFWKDDGGNSVQLNTTGGGADNLGDHTATQDIQLGTNNLIFNTGSELRFSDDNKIIPRKPSGALSMTGIGNAFINIDADNNNGSHFFSVRKDANDDSGQELFKVDETGLTTINGNVILSTGADRRIRLGSSSGYFYDVQSTGDDFQIIEAGNSAKVRFHIDYPTGNVGLGTITPSEKIHVNGGKLKVDGAGAGMLMTSGTANLQIDQAGFQMSDGTGGYLGQLNSSGFWWGSTLGKAGLSSSNFISVKVAGGFVKTSEKIETATSPNPDYPTDISEFYWLQFPNVANDYDIHSLSITNLTDNQCFEIVNSSAASGSAFDYIIHHDETAIPGGNARFLTPGSVDITLPPFGSAKVCRKASMSGFLVTSVSN